MKHILWAAIVAFGATLAVRAVTPLDAPLPEGQITTIECEYTGNDSVPGIGAADRGIYHYKVYVPTGYASEPTRRYPCLFIMSPGGNAGMGRASARLKRAGWIVVMAVEARNGPWGPIMGNLCAAHDDAIKRLRIAEGQKFATGFSGGARGSSTLVYLRRGFAGLWLQGAGLAAYDNRQYLKLPRNGLAVYATLGSWDSNLPELARVREMFSTFGFEIFDAGHAMPPVEVADRAVDWLEEQLYLNTPQAAVSPSQAAECFQRRHEAARTAESLLTKYHHAAVAHQLAAKHNLAARPNTAQLVQQVAAMLRQMEADPAMRAEKAAHVRYLEAQAKELHEQTGGGQKKPGATIPTQTIAAYQDIAGQYPSTEYGRLAAARAAELQAGPPQKGKKTK
jgi:hypothetical protein